MQTQSRLDPAFQRAEKILKQSGEYMSLVFNRDTINAKQLRFYRNIKQKPEDLKQKKLNGEVMAQLIVQVCYLLYLGYWHQIPIQIKESDIYIMVKQLSLKEGMNIYILYTINPKKQKIHLAAYMRKLIESILQNQKFFYQLQPNPFLRTFRSQLRAITNLIMQAKEEPIFLKCLEQTQLFRVTSILLKIKNTSFINLIKTHQGLFQSLQQRIKKQREYIRDFNMQTANNNQEQIYKAEQKIYSNIKGFFWQDLGQLIGVDQDSQSLNVDQTYGLRFYVICTQKQYQFARSIKNILGSRNILINDDFQIQAFKVFSSEYFIEYSTYRDTLCVKLVSEIKLDVQVSDFLMFQTSNLSFNSMNISIQLVQKYSGANAKVRYLTFKIHSSFTYKQPILEKIIMLMDILSVSQKILESFFVRSNKIIQQIFESPLLHKKVNHYVRIVYGLINKLYQKFNKLEI